MKYTERYLNKLWDVINQVEIKNKKKKNIVFDDAINIVIDKLKKVKKTDKKVIFIGNGGSAGIASHQSIDYWKNGGIPAICFNDPSLLTCLSNDYGYEYVFEKPIDMFGKKGDVLIAISSSGKSKNIINAVRAAKKKGLFVVTLSGFLKTNPLFKLGDLNFYVPSKSYGHVEISHAIISHTILDTYMKSNIWGIKNV